MPLKFECMIKNINLYSDERLMKAFKIHVDKEFSSENFDFARNLFLLNNDIQNGLYTNKKDELNEKLENLFKICKQDLNLPAETYRNLTNAHDRGLNIDDFIKALDDVNNLMKKDTVRRFIGSKAFKEYQTMRELEEKLNKDEVNLANQRLKYSTQLDNILNNYLANFDSNTPNLDILRTKIEFHASTNTNQLLSLQEIEKSKDSLRQTFLDLFKNEETPQELRASLLSSLKELGATDKALRHLGIEKEMLTELQKTESLKQTARTRAEEDKMLDEFLKDENIPQGRRISRTSILAHSEEEFRRQSEDSIRRSSSPINQPEQIINQEQIKPPEHGKLSDLKTAHQHEHSLKERAKAVQQSSADLQDINTDWGTLPSRESSKSFSVPNPEGKSLDQNLLLSKKDLKKREKPKLPTLKEGDEPQEPQKPKKNRPK